jgi:4-alpha-glucanotransferase
VNEGLARLCVAHGIEPTYTGLDGVLRHVPESTLFSLAEIFDISNAAPLPPSGIEEVRSEPSQQNCYVPDVLLHGRIWGITCQLTGLLSERNAGIGDFADLLAICRLAAAEGADFVGVNPLHALLWSDPGRVSPFFPSNRRFLNPIYLALEWIEGFAGLTDAELTISTAAKDAEIVDIPAVARLKDRVLRRLFSAFPRSAEEESNFRTFCDEGGAPLVAHAVFEAISELMTAEGRGATPGEWPEPLRRHGSPEVAAFAEGNCAAVDFHLWLQWLAHRQLDKVQQGARSAGMRIGLYLDCAVGSAPDGSAAWSDPTNTVPGVSIGAPPDFFNTGGQDWGLAPLSPVRLAALDGEPLARDLAAVARFAGALRIDHAMGIARLWLIPRGAPPADGAYVRYPLSSLLRRIAEVSHTSQSLVIGEDLGVVPVGFRELMNERALHRYMIFFFESDGDGFADPRHWPSAALACIATHDMPSLARWWHGTDLEIRETIGLLDPTESDGARHRRQMEREALARRLNLSTEAASDPLTLSTTLHRLLADSPSRLAALRLEDSLCLDTQANIPGTVLEYPNWVQRIPVAIEHLAENPLFRAHAAVMRNVRPR